MASCSYQSMPTTFRQGISRISTMQQCFRGQPICVVQKRQLRRAHARVQVSGLMKRMLHKWTEKVV
jgi:hypothetical protein